MMELNSFKPATAGFLLPKNWCDFGVILV